MNNKHQPCGKPGCIKCWTPVSGFDGQATPHNPWNRQLIEDEKRLARLQADLINTMNSPWAHLRNDIEAQGHVTRHPEPPQIQPAPVLKLIIRQAAYFLLLMLAVGVGLAVFL